MCGGYAPEGCAIAPPRGVPEEAPEGCRYLEPPHARGGLLCRRGAPERCTIALPRVCAGWGVPEGCRCWKPSHALGGLRCGRRGAPEGCAIALLRGCAGWGMPEGVCRRGAAVGNHRMSWEASFVGGGVPPEGCGIALPRGACRGRRRGVVVGSRRMPWEASYVGGGVRRRVCHSPAEGCRCWKPSHALGGLLCGRRGAPEGCAIALPRGVPEGDVAVRSRRMPWEASYVGGGVRRRDVP